MNTTAHAGEGTPGAGRAGGAARPWGLLRGAGPRLRTPGEDARKGTPLLSSPRPRSIATVQGQGGQQQPLLPPPNLVPAETGAGSGASSKARPSGATTLGRAGRQGGPGAEGAPRAQGPLSKAASAPGSFRTPALVPAYANQNKSEEDFHFQKDGRK